MPTFMTPRPPQSLDTSLLLNIVADAARNAGAFGAVVVKSGRVECAAAASAQPASYRIEVEDGGQIDVSLVMADRWQSHSIEADLLNTGDKVEELIAEELAEMGYDERVKGDSHVQCEHFRSEDKFFTFRSRVSAVVGEEGAAVIAGQWLRAYEAAFSRLGDMSAGDAE